MDKERISYLFKKYVDKTASLDETDELMQYLHIASEKDIEALLEKSYLSEELNEEFFTAVQRSKMLHAILSTANQESFTQGPRNAFLSKSILLKFSAVAALLLITLTIGFLLYRDNATKADRFETAQEVSLSDILPGGNKATLTLGDGTVILLDESGDGKIAMQHGIGITKTKDGQLHYDTQLSDEGVRNRKTAKMTYHTITTPQGGQYQVLLPDGTKVWLNASSSLKYPPLFSENERRVELTGEGYFEVAQNASSPFIVDTENQSVRVLGTHFNINSYKDMPITRTTLLEGSVMIDFFGADEKQLTRKLKPGEQATLDERHRMKVQKVDLSNAVAWKNGLFYFEDTPVEQVLAEFGRWYNFDFDFEGEVPAIKLWGSVYRDVNASDALEILDYFNLKYRLVKDTQKGDRWKIIVSNL